MLQICKEDIQQVFKTCQLASVLSLIQHAMGVLRHLCHTLNHGATEKAQSKVHRLKSTLVRNTNDFCKNTTLHGFKYITNKTLHGTERFFFAIAVFLVLLLSYFYIMKVYEKWVTTPVIVGINPEPSFITNEPFPAVTVCNLNQALTSRAGTFTNTSTEHEMLRLLCKKNSVNYNQVANTSTNWNDLERFILNVSQPCDRMLIGCRFASKEYNCSKHFFPIITDEGLCCVFNMVHFQYMYDNHIPLSMLNINSDNYEPVDWYAEAGYQKPLPDKFYPRTTAGIGESLGLSITLDVEAHKYFCSSSNSIGFKILLHSPNESPNVRETGVLIAPGAETKVRIRPEKTETTQNLRAIHTKYRHCYFHNERKLRYFAHYTQRNCEMECVAELLLQHCGCISFYMPKIYRNESVCGLQARHCVERVRLRLDPGIGSCTEYCLPSCYDLTFFADVFTIPIAHEGFLIESEHVQHYTHYYVKKNIALVNMYFKEYAFRSSIQTEFIGTSDFLSSVGGLMGLFLGFSIISIVELIFFAIIHPFRTYMQRRYSSVGDVLNFKAPRMGGAAIKRKPTAYKRSVGRRLSRIVYRRRIFDRPTMVRGMRSTAVMNLDVPRA